MAITAYLYYQDVRAAVKWLDRAFGFKRYGPSSKRNGEVVHAASNRRGPCCLASSSTGSSSTHGAAR